MGRLILDRREFMKKKKPSVIVIFDGSLSSPDEVEQHLACNTPLYCWLTAGGVTRPIPLLIRGVEDCGHKGEAHFECG